MIEIVRAELADLPVLAPLFDGYRQFYKQASDLTGAEHFLRERLEEQSSVIFVAWQKNEDSPPQASGFMQLYPSFSSTSMQRLWILNDLFVSPEARRSGVGRALLEHARDFAIQTHAKGLELSTAVDNFTAQSLYESTGWLRETEFYGYNLAL